VRCALLLSLFTLAAAFVPNDPEITADVVQLLRDTANTIEDVYKNKFNKDLPVSGYEDKSFFTHNLLNLAYVHVVVSELPEEPEGIGMLDKQLLKIEKMMRDNIY
ncbi:hypothetical protein PMAYCL1PPCAC_27618, partial [Pristionchus mayeri]